MIDRVAEKEAKASPLPGTRSRYNLVAPFCDLLERPAEQGPCRSWRADLWNTVRREAGDGESDGHIAQRRCSFAAGGIFSQAEPL